MFYSITGKVVHLDALSVAVDCGGVAFRLLCPRGVLSRLEEGQTASLFTHMLVRDDALELCGFGTNIEQQTFRLLLNVTGVGAKAAMAILSELSPDKLALCVASSDAKTIQTAQGVGAKLAQRIVLELKGKMMDFELGNGVDYGAIQNVSADGGSEALEALCALGYSRTEAARALSGLDVSMSADVLIRAALKIMNN
ncbi:MAG: Holliday junction branch migration protein RuvA [Oscillospiraceae bacterium]|jgi:Holliday junction DNA helicase RuvA|nr:Holliday junction branch migration protein RuvA [Oscillospiraceae bacterium]